MNLHLTAEDVMKLGGVCAFLFTLVGVIRRDLREKHALGWLAVALFFLLLGLFPDLLKRFAEFTQLSYPAAMLAIVLAAAYLFAFYLTLALGKQHKRTTRMTQELALLEQRLRRLEQTQERPAS